ncbi:MAG: metal-dependent hydrolase [Verrucomicrobiota bacterium]
MKNNSITWHGHSAFSIKHNGITLFIDPFLTGNPSCSINSIDELEAVDYVLLTHAHADHLGDAEAIAKKFQSNVIGIYEVCMWLGSKGVENVTPMNVGGGVDLGPFSIQMVQAFHSNSIETEPGTFIPAGDPAGLIITFDGLSIYHMGDTALFSDMKLIQEFYQPDLGLIPIGDRFTMGPKEAAYACNHFFNFKKVIPIHYDTFPLLTGKPETFKELVDKSEVVILESGESIAI